MELKSKYFSSLTELIYEKDRVKQKHEERRSREEIVLDFYNGKPIMSEGDAEDENLGDITNHLMGYSNMQTLETKLYSIWSTSNKIVDVDVLVGKDVEETERFSDMINHYLNKAIFSTPRFGSFWRSVAGEIAISGRVACVYREDKDWCPSVQPNMMLPDSMGTDASEATYAFIPRDMTISDLENLLDDEPSEDDDEETKEIDAAISDGTVTNNSVIKALIKTIEDNISTDNNDSNSTKTLKEKREATNTDKPITGDKTSVTVWYYYETRYDSDAKSKVVDVTMFTEDFRSTGEDPIQSIIAYLPAHYERTPSWMHLIVIDASIGGEKRFSTAKGIGEISYNSDVDAEEFLNRIMEGEKIRAVPRMRRREGGSVDELLGWNIHEDSIIPDSLESVKLEGSSNLAGALSLLQRNSSSITGSSVSNTGQGQELRQQAVERQGNNASTQSSRISDLYKSLDILMAEITRRFFKGDIDGGSPGYNEIMWFRKMMKEKKVPIEQLASEEFGFFEKIEVKSVRSSTSGESDSDLRAAQMLMSNLGNYPPAVRPILIRRFTTLITGDPEFSDRLVELLPKITSAQRVTAESEFEQIARDATLGLTTPIGADDIHQEHAPTHIKHLAVIVQASEFAPWTRREALHFGAIQQHAQLHIDELLLNNTSLAEGQALSQEMANVVSQADGLLADLVAREGEDAQGTDEMGDAERAHDIQIKEREQTRKDTDTASTITQRKERQESINRKGDQDFLLRNEQQKNAEAKQ
tara:strand:- start:2077 stop:4344 length:2268 start_codon:yes stop_codon:yes gene_type:complete